MYSGCTGAGRSSHCPGWRTCSENLRHTDTTHNPLDETHWVSCLREIFTSSSYGEGLETDRDTPVPRQSLTRQALRTWRLAGVSCNQSDE
jgi:hypothetical protein